MSRASEKLQRQSDRNQAIWEVLSGRDIGGMSFFLESLPDGDPVVVLKVNAGGKPVSWIWPNIYGKKSIAYYTNETPSKKAPGRALITMHPQPVLRPVLAILAGCVASHLPEETVRRILPSRRLSPNGAVPWSAVRSLRMEFYSFLKEKTAIDKGKGQSNSGDFTWSELSSTIREGWAYFKESYERLPSVTLDRELGRTRDLFRSLKDKVPFEQIRQIWDEEIIRGIHEA